MRTAITFAFSGDANADKTYAAIPIIIASSLELFIGIVSLTRLLQASLLEPIRTY